MASGRGRPVGHARLKCASCGKTASRSFKFCPHCGSPLAAAAASPIPQGANPAGSPVIAGPSLQVRTERTDALEEQRKVITVMFIDLAGSTASAERLDPEEWRRILQRYFAVLSKQIERFGGTIDKYIGDAVMAVFGAPIAREDDPHRAINAALAIKAEMAKVNDELERRFGVRLNLRTGINSGEVVAGLLEGGAEGAYTVTGDTVNTAQRLESAAPANEILVGEPTYELARRAFVLEQLPPLTLKGKQEPVPAYRVVMRDRRAVPREERTPFVGRDAEFGRLRELFAEAASGRGRVAHVHGEAGVGKSRLLQEFFSSLPPDAGRLRPRCTSFEGGAPYALVADVYRRAFGMQPTDDEATARSALLAGLESLAMPVDESTISLILEVLGYGQRSLLDPENKRRVLTSLVRRFLARRSANVPFAVVAEDVHWIDSASASLFTDVLKDVPSLSCLFITTSREEGVPWPAERIPLQPLDEAAAGALIDRIATAPLEPKLRATLLERTAGNPFFLEEVLRSVGGRARAAVPATVQELLQARLDDLDPSAKRVAQRAAVIGRFFSTRLLAELAPDEPLEAALADLEREGFISPREVAPELVYGFRHALMQETAYQVQLMAQRRALHGRVGGAVEALYSGRLEEFVDVLAFHYGRSDHDDKAVDWQVRAGDRARRLFANDEAISLYSAALQRVRDSAPVPAASILERIGDVHTTTSKFDDAIGTFRTAEKRVSGADGATIARLRRKVGVALRVKGAYREASDELASGLAVLGEVPGVEAARIRLEVGQLQMRLGDYAAARSALTEGVEFASALGAEAVVAEGLRELGNIALHGGDPKEGVELYERCWAIYERLEDVVGMASVRTNLASTYARLGRWDDALEQFNAAVALHQRAGNPLYTAITYNNIGEAHRLRGDLRQAIEAFERALSIASEIGYAAGVALAYTGLGAARVEAGDIERGRDDLLEAERRFIALGRTMYFADLYRFLAEAELRRADLDAATSAAERSLEFARSAKARHQEAMTQRVLAEIAIAQGDGERAKELLEASRQTLAELGEAGELRRTEAVLGRLSGR